MFLLLLSILSTNSAAASPFTLAEEKDKIQSWVFEQSLDHTGSNSSFSQRLFIDRRFAESEASPLLVEICAEWECSRWASQVTEESAKAHKAFIVKIEHRYYGKSHPFPELSTENLRFLKMELALQDLASVLEGLRDHLSFSGPVVTLGCSYAGNLSAYLRTLRPDLVAGSIAVSAPVRLKAVVAEKDLFTTRIFGESCAAAFRTKMHAFEERVLGLSREEFLSLLPKYKMNRTDMSLDSFFNLLGDMPGSLLQKEIYKDSCKSISNDGPEYFDFLFHRFNLVYEPEKESFEAAEETSVANAGSGSTIRQWLYQTCSEFGLFQVSHPDGLGPKRKNIESKLRMCGKLFGIHQLPDTEALNEKYLAPLLRSATKVVFTNGDLDFWNQLSLRPDNNTNPEIKTIMGAGGHCSGMRDFDKRGMPGPQSKLILDEIAGWLAP